jgi:hypothetical protein
MFNQNFSRIQFPIYHLGLEKPIQDGNKLYYQYITTSKEGDDCDVIQVLDDKSQPGLTLAMRRLQLKNQGVVLSKLKYAIFFIGDMLKMCKSTTWFIDSEGTVFEYRKTKKVPLVFRPIVQILPIKTGGAVIEVQGVGTRFKTLHAPKGTEKWAGVLLVGVAYVLYGLYDEKQPDTSRMV